MSWVIYCHGIIKWEKSIIIYSNKQSPKLSFIYTCVLPLIRYSGFPGDLSKYYLLFWVFQVICQNFIINFRFSRRFFKILSFISSFPGNLSKCYLVFPVSGWSVRILFCISGFPGDLSKYDLVFPVFQVICQNIILYFRFSRWSVKKFACISDVTGELSKYYPV